MPYHSDCLIRWFTIYSINSLIPAWFKLPENLAQNGYQNPSDPFHCAFNASFNTTDNIFEWYPKHPDVLDEFNEFMSSQREGHAYWLDFFPFDQQVGNPRANDTSDVLFVDVGGAVGNEVREIRKRYPTLPGRMILQDLPQTIAQAKGMGDFEVMVHDFFTPQPVKGNDLFSDNLVNGPCQNLAPASLTSLQERARTTFEMSFMTGPTSNVASSCSILAPP